MQTGEFLRRLFPLDGPNDPRAADLVRFAVRDPRAEDFPGTVHWRTRAELHALPEDGIAGLGFDTVGKDVYVTPHGFTRRGKTVEKEDAVALGDVAWVELDDTDIPPQTFRPAPSVVVETSPGRHHLYWLLEAPLPLDVVERINYRLVYGNGVKVDKGGWARTKWLRLPGSVSYKRADPFLVEVRAAALERTYGERDFDHLPTAPEVLTKQPDRPAPDASGLPTRAELEKTYSFTRELLDYLDTRRQDRSRALWHLYRLCYRLGMSQEECYALVAGSANDKFHDESRYNADEDLWRDVCKGYALAHDPEDTAVITAIKDIQAEPNVPAPEKRRRIAYRIAKDLTNEGRIYFDEARRDAYYFDGTHAIPMDPRDRRWKALINLRYRIVEGEKEFGPVNAHLYAIASAEGWKVTPRSFTYWDRAHGVLYISNHGGKVYRLDGERIDLVDNGTDEVFFRDAPAATPFLAEPEAACPTLTEAIFGLPNYEDDLAQHTAAQATLLARLWTYGLFFAEHMDARPHLTLLGPTDSGKTFLFQAISELLTGPGTTVNTLPYDLPTFETVVSNAHHAFFDNVDTPNKWLMDVLCQVASGIQVTRRVLYTTNESVTFPVQCHLGMTSREPWFTRADVSTRLVVLHVERRERKVSPTVLLDRIRAHRSGLWHALLTDLNAVIRAVRTQKPGEHKLRMAAFADFVLAACRGLGEPSTGLLEVIGQNQTGSTLNASTIWQCLEPWVRRRAKDPRTNEETMPNSGQRINAARLHRELRVIAGEQGIARKYEHDVPTAKHLSHQLRELIPDIRERMAVEVIRRSTANEYRFTVPDDAGKTLPHELPEAAD